MFKHPFDPKTLVVKRVAAMPGEVVMNPKDGKRFVIPEGKIWVLSDNPHKGVDSRDFGPVCQGLILGTCSSIIWPLHRIRPLK